MSYDSLSPRILWRASTLTYYSYLPNPEGRGILALLATATRLQIPHVRDFVHTHLRGEAKMGVITMVGNILPIGSPKGGLSDNAVGQRVPKLCVFLSAPLLRPKKA